jgi:hypothetical protein
MTEASILKVYLGSFLYTWQVQDHGDGTATIKFRASNKVTWKSLTNLGRGYYVLPDFSRGPLATQYQYFEWEMIINYNDV